MIPRINCTINVIIVTCGSTSVVKEGYTNYTLALLHHQQGLMLMASERTIVLLRVSFNIVWAANQRVKWVFVQIKFKRLAKALLSGVE